MAEAPPRFPPQLHVFVRDWLSSNNILLKSRNGHVLVDTGYGKHVAMTQALLQSGVGIGEAPLALIVNTHCHSDHMGGNAALQRRYGCPIAIPAGEAPLVENWDLAGLWLDYAGQHCERFSVGQVLEPGATATWGDLEWQLIAAPGHDMGALVFHNPEHRLLISGDALWERGFGFIMPPELDPAALPATRATLDLLAGLDVAAVIPGHGNPFTGVAAALERAYSRVEAFEQDSERMARHAVKVIFTFALLEKEHMATDAVLAHFAEVPFYQALNDRYFRWPLEKLAEWAVTELAKVGAVRIADGVVTPG